MSEFKLPAPSIILEWETVLEGGSERLQKALHEMAAQIVALQPLLNGVAEVIVCHDPAVIESGTLLPFLQDAMGAHAGRSFGLQLCAVDPDSDYYEKKNRGALVAHNDILLFFDTDLLPDTGWLRGMLEPFLQWHIAVVVGATHLDHASTYDMAVALFWIFTPAVVASTLRPTKRLVSNNIAFRRAVFTRFPFPRRPTHRGQCTELGLQLMGAGITMYEQTGARASHPPPPGVRGFIARAWAAGVDEEFYHALNGDASLGSCLRQLHTDLGSVSRRISERSKVLEPNVQGLMAGWALGVSYYGIKATGYLVALIRAGFAGRVSTSTSAT